MAALTEKKSFEITAGGLHIMAMFFMLLDHMWATVVPGQEWLTCVGRIAFPIFAFLTVEGYFHTHSFKKYMMRLGAFALISEIPFNLMNGALIYPFHQNVIWTFMIALAGIWLIDRAKRWLKWWLVVPVAAMIILVTAVAGQIAMTDYFSAGVLTVYAFYLFHGRKWWCFAGQLVSLYVIHVRLLGSAYYTIQLFGMEFHFVQQGLALLALIPIWLYRGRQGQHSKAFQYFCYAFYPVHMVVLYLIAVVIG